MELDQLIPEQATWERTIEGEGETRTLNLTFRPFNLEDESWLKVAFGDELQSKFETMDMDAITRIAFRQLEVESKRELMKLKFMDVDEDGADVEIAKKGSHKLGKLIIGYPDQIELIKILLKTRGFSMPIIDELGEDLVEDFKEKTKGKRKARKQK